MSKFVVTKFEFEIVHHPILTNIVWLQLRWMVNGRTHKQWRTAIARHSSLEQVAHAACWCAYELGLNVRRFFPHTVRVADFK